MSRTDPRYRHHLPKPDCDTELRALRDELNRERKLRMAAEKNATQMHALLIQARVRALSANKETNASDPTPS